MFRDIAACVALIVFLSVTVVSCNKERTTGKEDKLTQEELMTRLANTEVSSGTMTVGNGKVIAVDFYFNSEDSIVYVLFNGEPPLYEPRRFGSYHNKAEAYDACAYCMDHYPCVQMVHTVRSRHESFFGNGEPVHDYVIYYDDYDEDGDCWFNKM